MTPIVLALDLGRSTGWACSTGGSGAMEFTPRAVEQKGHGWLGWRFGAWLGDLLHETGAGIVVLERMVSNPRFVGYEGQRVTLGLRMIALTSCWGNERAVEEVSPASWQAFAKKNLPWWEKGDEADAKAMLAWWTATRLPKLEAA